ncbi:hypothetical protein EDD16DRAFT_1714578 [Pisolithus croceorrhizus]|nr:hypothetical protein EDD16DRAFT_1714578 [Pisolithus croceorrhizus]KAI6165590.1 hypothetical protein EDD17DRAFT_1753752 [Pisolithus thermaeus]
MTYGDASHPILSTSDFDLSAVMTFDFPPLSIFETDVDAMMNGNTSLTAMGGLVQWSFGSTYGMSQVPMPASSPIAARTNSFQPFTLDLANNLSTTITVSPRAADIGCISSGVTPGEENAVVGLPPIPPTTSPPSVPNLPLLPLPSI